MHRLSSGVTGTTIGYPLDLLKTRLQVSKDRARTPNNNIIQMSKTILKSEGIQGFFKGLMSPLVSISFLSAVTFASYSWLRPKLGAQQGWDLRNATAATLTAPVMVPITTLEALVRVSWLYCYNYATASGVEIETDSFSLTSSAPTLSSTIQHKRR